MKFGGTSVADADAMTRVIDIVRNQIARHPDDRLPVVVVSAMSKVTDRLVETGRLAGEGLGGRACRLRGDLWARHVGGAPSLVQGDALARLIAELTADFSGLTAKVREWAADGDVSPAATDAVLAMGELAS